MLKIGDKVTLHNGLKGTIIDIANGVEYFYDENRTSLSMPRALYRVQCGASVFAYYTYRLDRNNVYTDITKVLVNYSYSHDELVELNAKEQLKYYINLYTDEETEKEKLLELVDKL